MTVPSFREAVLTATEAVDASPPDQELLAWTVFRYYKQGLPDTTARTAVCLVFKFLSRRCRQGETLHANVERSRTVAKNTIAIFG
jgi:hypothetical protein